CPTLLCSRSLHDALPIWEVLRAKIVLLAAEGLENAEIARRLDTTREAVSRWRKRFYDERLQGLEDRPRAGRPRRFSPRGGGRGRSEEHTSELQSPDQLVC